MVKEELNGSVIKILVLEMLVAMTRSVAWYGVSEPPRSEFILFNIKFRYSMVSILYIEVYHQKPVDKMSHYFFKNFPIRLSCDVIKCNFSAVLSNS